MSATGRAVRIASGPRYRLVATFSGGEEVAREGFDSFPAAQAEVGTFVCEVASRGRPAWIRVERFPQAEADRNGNGRHDPLRPGEILRRWDETVIDRILRQQSERERAGGAAVGDQSHDAASGAAVERPARDFTSPETAAWRTEPPQSAPIAETPTAEPSWSEARIPPEPVTPALDLSAVVHDAEAATDLELGLPVRAAIEAVAEIPGHQTAAPLTEPAAKSAQTVQPEPMRPAEIDQPAPVSVAQELGAATTDGGFNATAARQGPHRPRHRRTRWVLILTAVFIAIVFGWMILLETNGDPIGYLLRMSSGEKVRETLPFRNGDGPARKPAKWK